MALYQFDNINAVMENRVKVALIQKVLENFQIAQKMCRKLSWTLKILNMTLKNCQLSVFLHLQVESVYKF